MILDIHGKDALIAACEINERDLYPFKSMVHASSGEHALEIDQVDRVVIVIEGFVTDEERRKAVEHFENRGMIPRILEIKVVEKSNIFDALDSSLSCPYNSIIFTSDLDNFHLCVSECLGREIIIGIVRDIFGDDAGKIVHAYLGGSNLDPLQTKMAVQYMMEAKKYYDDWRDDVPELY